ncbi:hypothetical protein [Micromonospora sp. NBC_01813]|uniref:hypothetical protein n=1 Tax=Micromonospora sp. NBC_01813 TaxID=2975988 RepID=UPI002DD8FD08|nr:hypothetical protein [Micromonospora sp. NBC_01813]WSA06870.1 hypothetical protein OG958_21655 [Micromonospora sp. NBC_01813]
MTEDRDAEVCQILHPEDIPLDVVEEIGDSVFAHLMRWLREAPDEPGEAVARFNNFI